MTQQSISAFLMHHHYEMSIQHHCLTPSIAQTFAAST